MTDMTPDTVIEASDRFRAGLISRDLVVQKRLISTYQSIYAGLQDKIELLTDEIIMKGLPMSRGQAVKMARYQSLLRAIEEEMRGYSIYLKTELSTAAKVALEQAVKDAKYITAQAVIADGGQIAVSQLNTLNPAVIEQLLGFLDPEGPLYANIDKLGKYTADRVSTAILDGVAIGKNPQVTARRIFKDITKELGGTLTSAMRMVRTSQLYAYREASRATYLANGDVVEGWIWHAALDGRTCPACVAMHGTKHPLSERLNDHYNGRAEVQGNVILSDDTSALETLRYNGDIVIISTASGKFLAVTPDHPVLTSRGWIAAKFIKEGYNVVSADFGNRASFSMSPDINNVPTAVEYLPHALNMVRLGSVPETAKHLHSYREDGEIDTVYINRLLWNSIDASSRQKVLEHYFGHRHPGGFLSCMSRTYQAFMASLATAYNILSSNHQRSSFCGAHANITDGVSFRHGSYNNIILIQDAANSTSRNIELIGKLKLRHQEVAITADNNINSLSTESDFIPGVNGNFAAFDLLHFGGTPSDTISIDTVREALITNMPHSSGIFDAITRDVIFDSVINVDTRGFSGHVYSLQSKKGWYYSNSIISHNCAMVPITILNPDRKVESGEDWFKQQDDATQKQILGTGRYDAWKDGQFQLGDIVTQRPDNVYGEMRVPKPLKELVHGPTE